MNPLYHDAIERRLAVPLHEGPDKTTTLAEAMTPAVVGSSLVPLSLLGGTAARLGGSPLITGAARVASWGAVAMGCTALVGRVFVAVAWMRLHCRVS